MRRPESESVRDETREGRRRTSLVWVFCSGRVPSLSAGSSWWYMTTGWNSSQCLRGTDPDDHLNFRFPVRLCLSRAFPCSDIIGAGVIGRTESNHAVTHSSLYRVRRVFPVAKQTRVFCCEDRAQTRDAPTQGTITGVINECSSVQKRQRVRRVEDQETWGQHGSGVYPKRSSGSSLEECHGAIIGFDR